MKPSNKGPWGCKCQTLHHRVAGDGCDECNPDMARQIEIDNAVDDAIAEYRKELAAKAERQRIRRPTREGLAFNSAIEQVLHVINENDDE